MRKPINVLQKLIGNVSKNKCNKRKLHFVNASLNLINMSVPEVSKNNDFRNCIYLEEVIEHPHSWLYTFFVD